MPRFLAPLANLNAMRRDPLAFLTRLAMESSDVVVPFHIGPQKAWLFTHPDSIRDLLVTHDRSFMKGRALQRTKVLLGEGLLTSEGELHRRQRRLAAPSFHRDRIARYVEVMKANAIATAESWRDGQEIDAAREMNRLALAIVAQTLFGTDVSGEADDISRALTDAMESFDIILYPFPDWMRIFSVAKRRRMERAVARLDTTIYRVVEERRRNPTDDLISMLLLAQDEEGTGSMSNKQVRDEAMTLFLAGHETTANALAWTWYLLAQHPEVESKLHADPATYAQPIIAEAMRLYPPAWIIGRLALEDVTIGAHTIRRGNVAIACQYVMHRHPAYWKDPQRFDPTRFIGTSDRPKFAYFPFGGGSRICIGEGFAWTEGVTILTTIAERWRLRLAQTEPVAPLPTITLRPRGGIRMRLAAR
jgi:cytochrome P450